jgi:hypothetical protein
MSLVVVSGWLEQVDRGADNPISYMPNYHETRKGGQGPSRDAVPLKKKKKGAGRTRQKLGLTNGLEGEIEGS